MKKILTSMVVIFAMAAVAVGATSAAFTSKAKVTGNTFSTGSLQIKVDGKTSELGFSVDKALPGTNDQDRIVNVENPYRMRGLTAKHLTLSANKTAGDATLWSGINIVVYASTTPLSNKSWNLAYSGPISGLQDANILPTSMKKFGLMPGARMAIRYVVGLPDNANSQNLFDQSVGYDLIFNATTR